MQASELKPCPFCGGKAKYIYSSHTPTYPIWVRASIRSSQTVRRHTPTYPIGVRCNRCKSEFQFYDKNENTMTDFQKILTKFNKRK